MFGMFGVFAVIIIIVWGVCFANRMQAGSEAEDALNVMEQTGSRVSSQSRRVTEWMDNLTMLVSSRDAKKSELIYALQQLQKEYDTYTALVHTYNRDRKEAAHSLHKLARAQNMTGGANDLGAIGYYRRSSRFDQIDGFQEPYIDRAILEKAKEKIASMEVERLNVVEY